MISNQAIDKIVYDIDLSPNYYTQWTVVVENHTILVQADVDYWYILRNLEVDIISDADGEVAELPREQFDYMWRELQAKLDEMVLNAA